MGNPLSIRLVTDRSKVGGWAGDTSPRFRSALLEVGGVDITRTVRSIDFHAEGGQLPVVTIGLNIDEAEIEDDAVFQVSAETRDLLIKLGWTPPVAE